MFTRFFLFVLAVVIFKVHVAFSNVYGQGFDVAEFKRNWCRQRQAALDWKAIFEPCKRDMEYNNNSVRSVNLTEGTSYKNSLVLTKIAPAGQFSHIRIEARDKFGNPKNYGGDAWRVSFRSASATLAADVFDFNNGTYEALALLMEPGVYTLDVRLDYTLCDGIRNPPVEWFHKVHCSGVLKNQTDIGTELFADMQDYINRKIGEGQILTIQVPSSNIDPTGHAQLMVEADNECSLPCSKKLWDGYGRWDIENNWKPFMDEINLPSSQGRWNKFEGRKNLDYIGKHKKGEGTFWIYGDSLSFYFYESFSKTQQTFCETHFKMCNVSYNWIYPKTLYELTETCGETELKVPKVVHYLREVTNKPNMIDENSVLLFNAGAHYVKTASFEQYKEAISEIARVLSEEFKGKAIWKSTAAMHDQTATVMGSFRRFTTDQRIKLFNAYSNEVMCKAGVTFLDIYPISASYPGGTKDGIHYTSEVFYPVEELLVGYFSHE